MLNLDKEKYLNIARTQGLPAALSALHQEYGHLEFESFEGNHGYQPEEWKSLTVIRDFSRELWDMAAKQGAGYNPFLKR